MSRPESQKIIQQKYAEQKEFELIEQYVGSSKQLNQFIFQPISAHTLIQVQKVDRMEQVQKLRDLLEQVSLKNDSRSRSNTRLLPSATVTNLQRTQSSNMLLTLENANKRREQSPQTPQLINTKFDEELPNSPNMPSIIEMANKERNRPQYCQESHCGTFKNVFKRQIQQRDGEIFSFNSSTKENTNGMPSNFLYRLKPNSNLLQNTLKTSLQKITNKMQEDFNQLTIINDLIYNEQSHTVTVFKDYLILDDINEFLKRPYSKIEVKQRLPKLFTFYESYSQVFPNYVCLPESKYMFKNIQRKQKLIDEQNQTQKAIQSLLKEDRLFDTKFKDSVQNHKLTNDEYDNNLTLLNPADICLTHSRKRSSDAPNLLKKHALLSPSRSPTEDLQNFMENFIQKDTQQSMQLDLSMGKEFLDSFLKFTSNRGLGQFEGAPSQIQSYLGDDSVVVADSSDARKIPQEMIKQTEPEITPRIQIQNQVKRKNQSKPVEQKQQQSQVKSKSPEKILKTQSLKPTYYQRNNKTIAQQSPLAQGKQIGKAQISQEKLTVKIPKAIKTLELNKPPQQPRQALGTSPTMMVTPRAYIGEEENVDEFLDVEIKRGKVVADTRKLSAGSDTVEEEETVRSDGTKTNLDRERLCPSALIMSGGLSSLNTHSQSVQGSVIGLISAQKYQQIHQQSLNSAVTRAKTTLQNIPPLYISQARTSVGMMTRLQSPKQSPGKSSPINQNQQSPISSDKPLRYQQPTINDIKASQDFSKIKRHLENVYQSSIKSQTSHRTTAKTQTSLAKVLEERQTQFNLKFKGLSVKSSNQNSRSNLLANLQVNQHRQHPEVNPIPQKNVLNQKSKVLPISQLRNIRQSKSPSSGVPSVAQKAEKRRSSNIKNEYRKLQSGMMTLTRTGLSASSASPTQTQQVCIIDTHNTRVLYSSILMQTKNRSPVNLPLPTKPRNISPQAIQSTMPKTSHFILPSQKKPHFFGQQQIQAMGALISKKQLNLN